MSKTGKSQTLKILPRSILSTGKINRDIIAANNGIVLNVKSRIEDTAFSVSSKNNETSVISFHSGFLASDVKDSSGNFYYYKIIKVKEVKEIEDRNSNTISFITDNTFIYVNTKDTVNIIYTDGTVDIVKAVPIFLNSTYSNNGVLYSDNKTFRVKKYYLKLKTVFNKGDLSIIMDDNTGVFEYENIVTIPSIAIMGNHILDNVLRYSDSGLSNILDNQDGNYFKYKSGQSGYYNSLSFLIKDETVYFEVCENNGSISVAQYNIREEQIGEYVNTQQHTIIMSASVKREQSIYAFIPVEEKDDDIVYCGSDLVLSNFFGYSKSDITHSGQKRFSSGGVKIFDIQHYNVTDINNIRVINKENQEKDYTFVDGFIYIKTQEKVGIKYGNSVPDKFI